MDGHIGIARDPCGSTTAYNTDNQLHLDTYDGEGDPTAYSGATFGFDSEDRLTSISSPSFAAVYDGDGLRALKTVTIPVDGTNKSVTTFFIDDGDTPVLEENAAGGVTAAMGCGEDGIRERFYPGAFPGATAGTAQATAWGSQYYSSTFDPQGNLVQRQSENNFVSDAFDTSVYDAYGALTRSGTAADFDAATGAPEALKDPIGFGGEWGYYTDPETGLDLLGHRYYDAGTGRFLNRDPIGYSGGINLYDAFGGNPVNEGDPEGYDPKLTRAQRLARY